MTQPLSNTGWDIGRPNPVCAACGTTLGPGQTCWAALVERRAAGTVATSSDDTDAARHQSADAQSPSPYTRLDFCEPCWQAGRRPADTAAGDMFSFWKTAVSVPQQKKRLLVDDSVLVDLFTRLEDRTDPADIRFRFVLALILMRKRLLRYESTEPASAAIAAILAAAPAPAHTVASESSPETAAESAAPDSAAAPAPPPAPPADGAPPKAPEIWLMTPRGSAAPVAVINPQLTRDQIAEVSQQLTQILAEEI